MHERVEKLQLSRDVVRDDFPVIYGKPFSGPAKTAHHLIRDKQDSVTITKAAHPLKVSLRWNIDLINRD